MNRLMSPHSWCSAPRFSGQGFLKPSVWELWRLVRKQSVAEEHLCMLRDVLDSRKPALEALPDEVTVELGTERKSDNNGFEGLADCFTLTVKLPQPDDAVRDSRRVFTLAYRLRNEEAMVDRPEVCQTKLLVALDELLALAKKLCYWYGIPEKPTQKEL